MKRRAFISLLGCTAAAWPLAAGAQQPAMPVIGFLGAGSPGPFAPQVAVFRQGLAEAGYVEGRNVTIEYRWAEGQYDRLPAMAAELVHRQVAAIVTFPIPAAIAAKAATATIPIVFNVAGDPVKLGLVAGLARPGSNATGVNSFLAELGAKQLGLLRELLPTAARIGLLVNPGNTSSAEATLREVPEAARALGLQIQALNASTSREIEAAFATLVRERADALLVAGDGFLISRRVQFATLATRHGVPTAYGVREHVEAGGLMSYGTELLDMYRQAAVYTGQILAKHI